MEIVDGRRHFGASLAELAKSGHIAKRAQRAGHQVPAMTVISDAPALKARIYSNQWIVDCPDCKNAEFAFTGEHLFMCSECFNGAVGGGYRRVEFPKNLAAIEMVLKARPVPKTRNWDPGETVTDLKRENREHRLPEEAVL